MEQEHKMKVNLIGKTTVYPTYSKPTQKRHVFFQLRGTLRFNHNYSSWENNTIIHLYQDSMSKFGVADCIELSTIRNIFY